MGKKNPPAMAASTGLRHVTAMLLACTLISTTGDWAKAQDATQPQAAAGAEAEDDNALDALTSAISTYKKNLQDIKDALKEAPEPSTLTGELTTAKDIIDDLTVQLNQIRDERDAITTELIEYREATDATIASLRLDSERDRGLRSRGGQFVFRSPVRSSARDWTHFLIARAGAN